MKIGIIGTGNMGSILIQAMIESQSVEPRNLIITNRSIEKANRLKKQYPNIHIANDPIEVSKTCQFIFICVKPLQIYPLLQQLNDTLDERKVIVSITSPISTDELEHATNCQVARIIPSITNRALSGCTLISYGKRVTEENRRTLSSIMESFSKPIYISEEHTRVASDIVSCGPAFFSYLLQQFIDGAVRQTTISREVATELTCNMLIGLCSLIEKNYYSLETLQEKVTVKGGITGIGIDVLEKHVGDMFDQLFIETHRKYAEDRNEISEQFFNNV
ncbi:late competence protein ComER [Pueribacillus sp. YX66]|uniref:late competence protein ComER n=1 Tax=Pueribacillus sp. YX66 TaxID=3229242 RepID=UPI00358D6C8C